MLDSPLAEGEGCGFSGHMVFLKLAGYIMPLWEEGIAVFVSEPVTGVIGKRKSRLVRFVAHSGALNSPQACFIIRFQSRKYFRCRLANSLSLKKLGLSNPILSLSLILLFGCWNFLSFLFHHRGSPIFC